MCFKGLILFHFIFHLKEKKGLPAILNQSESDIRGRVAERFNASVLKTDVV